MKQDDEIKAYWNYKENRPMNDEERKIADEMLYNARNQQKQEKEKREAEELKLEMRDIQFKGMIAPIIVFLLLFVSRHDFIKWVYQAKNDVADQFTFVNLMKFIGSSLLVIGFSLACGYLCGLVFSLIERAIVKEYNARLWIAIPVLIGIGILFCIVM